LRRLSEAFKEEMREVREEIYFQERWWCGVFTDDEDPDIRQDQDFWGA
jgi:hypothetical protein